MRVILPLLRKPETENHQQPQLQLPLYPPDWYIAELERRKNAIPENDEVSRGVIIIPM
jgi:hypothetical protein